MQWSPKHVWLSATVLIAALASSCRSAPELPRATAAVSTIDSVLDYDGFTLGAGDVISVSVYGHPELSTPRDGSFVGTRIDPDGTLSLPLAGTVPVGGIRLAEARARITAAYEPFVKEPRIDFSVVEWSARRFYLYGEVEQPGSYVMDRPLTAYQGLALGGGFKKNAVRREIVLLRGDPENLEVHAIDGANPAASGLVALRPDDFLFVRKSGPGQFADEVLPILTGISSSLGSLATVLLIEERLKDG